MLKNPLILCIESRIEKSTSLYARFQIGPITEGHGLTIGNALRRVLLSDLSTVSIIAAKIQLGDGTLVPHEYSSLPGVRESTLDLLLNLRQVVLNSDEYDEEPIVGFIDARGPNIITAKDIRFSKNIKIVDPNQYIATINEDSNLSIQLLAACGKHGKSYVNVDPSEPGLFLLEPSFVPLNLVNYKIESNQVITTSNFSQKSDEQIILEITTNGSIHPLSALKIALLKLQTLFGSISFNPLLNIESSKSEVGILANKSFAIDTKTLSFEDMNKQGGTIGNEIPFAYSIKKRLCSLDLANLSFSFQTYFDLKSNDLNTVGDIVFSDLALLQKKLKKESFKETQLILTKLGLKNI